MVSGVHGPLALRHVCSVPVNSGYGPWSAWSSYSKTCMFCSSEQWLWFVECMVLLQYDMYVLFQ